MFLNMAYLLTSRSHSVIDGYDLIWATLDPDAKVCFSEEKPKKLLDVCAEKLISDVLLVERYCFKLPKSIHLLIFSKAIAKKRTLSVEQLMKFCPSETLEMPIPDVLKSLYYVPQINNSIMQHELMDLTRISLTMLSVFFNIIKKNNSNSALRSLDLGLFPLRNAALVKIQEFLFKDGSKILCFTKKYTLKCTVMVENSTDLCILRACTEKSSLLGFELIVTGINFYNNFLMDVEAIKLLESIKKTNLHLISFIFANLIPDFHLFFNKLKFFRSVKYLNISYLINLLASEIDAREFASRLSELAHLERLVLKGIHLKGVLSTFLLEYCKNHHCDVSPPDCCFIHSGSLHYLDISACKLSVKDLEFLKELSATNSLKYLDISENSLHEMRIFEVLLFLKYSLQALNISSCFKHLIEYDASIMPFSYFTQLKYLNIKGLQCSENSKHLLECELQNMQSLEILETSIPLSLPGVTVII